MNSNKIYSKIAFFSGLTAAIIVLFFAGIIIHSQKTGNVKYLSFVPVIGQSIRAEHLRKEGQKSAEVLWEKEGTILPHKNYAEWHMEILDPKTPLTAIEWKELTWENGDEVKKREARVLLHYPDKIIIGDLPNYVLKNEYEMNLIRRQADNTLIYGTNKERLDLDLPAVLIQDSKETIALFKRNKFLDWLIKNPVIATFTIPLMLMLFYMRRQMGMLLDSYSSKSTFVRYKPPKKGAKTTEDIGGLPHVNEAIEKFLITASYPKIMSAFGGRLLPGVLLSGPPGTGKSLTANVLSNIAYGMGFSVYLVHSSMLMDFAPASAPRKIHHGFKRARQDGKSMIVFDEVEAFARTRRPTQSGHEEEKSDALVQLLTEIEGVATSSATNTIVVVLISNRPELIDAALLRSGRVGLHLELPPPKTKEARKEILTIHAKNSRLPKDKQGEWLDVIAKETDGFTGADLRDIFSDAGSIAAAPHAEKCKKLRKRDDPQNIPPSAHVDIQDLRRAADVIRENKKIKNK